jgi:beta-ribofuranosylaminobenzene 5'-phosphate synthase
MPADGPTANAATAVEIRTPARAHLGMMSFGHSDVRSFGGLGVMLDRPGVHVRLRRAGRLEARGPHAERALACARVCGHAWNLGEFGCSIDVVAAPRSHVGLGSGTQLALAVAAGIRHLFVHADSDEPPGIPHPGQDAIDPEDHDWLFDTRDALELAGVMGRGRRSCVGVHGFSRGGLIVEAGRRIAPADAMGDDETAAGTASGFSPMVARVRLPSAWRCVVLIGRDAVGLSGAEERTAFRELPPVPREVSAELARIALLDLLPAAVEGAFAEFSAAVRAYGLLAGQPFASASAKLPYAEATADLLELLAELGAPGAAQSSWGPAVIACCESLDRASDLLERLDGLGLGRHHDMIIARFDSQGAVLRVVE